MQHFGIWQLFKKLNVSNDLVIPQLRYMLKHGETYNHVKTCTAMFIKAFFIAKHWDNPNVYNWWMNKQHTYISAVQKNQQ